MKKTFGVLFLLACACFISAGCLHDVVEDSCSLSRDGLSFTGNCAFDLDDLVNDLRDRFDD